MTLSTKTLIQTDAGMKTLVFGVLSAILYTALFWWGQDIVQLTTQGGWYFILPVVIAFVFSYVHGVFTSNFWEWLGVQAKN